MKTASIKVSGFDVEIFDFGYAKYMYPSFNGNAEFEVNKSGFKVLSSYLRTVIFFNRLKG